MRRGANLWRQLVAPLRVGPDIDFGFCELYNLDDARAVELFRDFCTEVASQAVPLSPVAREIEAKVGEMDYEELWLIAKIRNWAVRSAQTGFAG